MLLHVYQAICVLIAGLIVTLVWRSKDPGEQVTGAIVLVPLLLRIFLVK